MDPKWSPGDNRRADPGAAGAPVGRGARREEDGGEEEQPGGEEVQPGGEEVQLWREEEVQLRLHLHPRPGGGPQDTPGKSLKLLQTPF